MATSRCLKVFVQRDYNDGTAVKFQSKFPPELEGKVSICCSMKKPVWFNVNYYCFLSYKKLFIVTFIQVDKSEFEKTIGQLNEMYAEAEALSSRTYCESCCACLTGYLLYLCMETYYEKVC